MDYTGPGKDKLNTKLKSACGTECQEMKAKAEADIAQVEKKAVVILAKEEKKASKEVGVFDSLLAGLSEIQNQAESLEEEGTVPKFPDFQNQVQQSELNEKDKKELLQKTKETAESECEKVNVQFFVRI